MDIVDEEYVTDNVKEIAIIVYNSYLEQEESNMTKEKPKFTHIRIASTGELKIYQDKGEPITVEVDDNMAEYIGSMLAEIKPGNLIESLRASKNAAEIFCRTTNYGYKTFNSYALDAVNYDPEDLPR